MASVRSLACQWDSVVRVQLGFELLCSRGFLVGTLGVLGVVLLLAL